MKEHKTVLLYEAVEALNVKKNGIYIDCTYGTGGHTRLILKKLNDYGKLIAIEKDIKNNFLNINDKRYILIRNNFSNIYFYIKKYKLLNNINGVLLDLGISSIQLNDYIRGFSYIKDGDLDMRININDKITAKKWLLTAKKKEMIYVFRYIGNEKFASSIAKEIYLNKNKINSNIDLINIIKNKFPINYKKILKRIFLSIRIYINNEIIELLTFLKYVYKILCTKGRISIITFNSLEDKIINNFIKKNNKIKTIKNLGKIKSSLIEKKTNKSSKYAILRIAEKI